MNNLDDYRFQSHELLLELDAATTNLMMLVSARQLEGTLWNEATYRQKLAYETWTTFHTRLQGGLLPISMLMRSTP